MVKKDKKIKDTEVKEEEIKDKDLKVKVFKEEIDKYIKQRVDEETKKGINIKDYKNQIDKYAKERVEVESSSQTVKNLKKQLSSKKCASGIKTFIILCLLACIGYGIYYLYEDGYFDENKTKECNCPVNNCVPSDKDDTKKEDTSKDKKEENNLDTYKEKYSYLLENIIFDLNSNYTRDYYNGNLTNELKEYLSYKIIDKDNIISDDNSTYFELSDLETAYNVLFNEKLNPSSFKYNNASFTYLESKEMFVSNNKPNEEKVVTREIENIEINGKNIVITTVEGYVAPNGRLYNILTNKRITSYKANDSLLKYKNKLNVIKYTFSDDHLVSINK